jgi:hypothetical protein
MEVDKSINSGKVKNLKKNPNVFVACIQNSLKSYYTVMAALTFLNKTENEKKNLEFKYKKLLEDENILNYKLILRPKNKGQSLSEQIKDLSEFLENETPTHIFIGYSETKVTNSLIIQTDYRKFLNNSFIINRITIPCMLIKNKTLRESNPDKNFKWLIFLKSGDNISFYVLIKLMQFIDIKNDEIHGFHITSDTIKDKKLEKKKDSESEGK